MLIDLDPIELLIIVYKFQNPLKVLVICIVSSGTEILTALLSGLPGPGEIITLSK